jgi:signal recognition particle receptor subunit alpha
MDNEFDLVFVIGYQKILSLSYTDKFLTDIQLTFRDKYNDFDLRTLLKNSSLNGTVETTRKKKTVSHNLIDFTPEYIEVYEKCTTKGGNEVKQMRSFEQSSKSQKSVASMIIKSTREDIKEVHKKKEHEKKTDQDTMNPIQKLIANGVVPRGAGKVETKSPKVSKKELKEKEEKTKEKKGKASRSWGLSGKNDPSLDYSRCDDVDQQHSSITKNMSGGRGVDLTADYVIKDSQMDVLLETSEEEEEEEEVQAKTKKSSSKSKGGFFSSLVNTLSLNQVLTKESLAPVLLKLRDHLIAKNVASNVAANIMESVEKELDGKSVNTWSGLEGAVREELKKSIGRILSPNRVIDILSDIRNKKKGVPHVITFCGVNGVGKSTNLAKIANWLIQNGVQVCVIACDTFRAGAVEQLRTHVTALQHIITRDGLNGRIHLHEKGYGKDSAAIAMEGITFARNNGFNCCLVDTAGEFVRFSRSFNE